LKEDLIVDEYKEKTPFVINPGYVFSKDFTFGYSNNFALRNISSGR
jgi:hypothetical protein